MAGTSAERLLRAVSRARTGGGCCIEATGRRESATGTRTLRQGAKLVGPWCVCPTIMPIPDEKARAWTRPEDYWPPRRSRRSGKASFNRFAPPAGSGPEREARPLLDIIPYAALMLGLAVLAIAIMALAWPGRTIRQAPTEAVPAEVGTAPKGWMDRPEPARS
jgi:hypothetical protein